MQTFMGGRPCEMGAEWSYAATNYQNLDEARKASP